MSSDPSSLLTDFRQDLYKKGGLISVTSQIFTVDMLTADIPTHLITGVIILHAERYLLYFYEPMNEISQYLE